MYKNGKLEENWPIIFEANLKHGEFFITFDEFCEVFNSYCVIFDVKSMQYKGVRFEEKLTSTNCMGMERAVVIDTEYSTNPHYLMKVNRQSSKSAKVLISLQMEDNKVMRDPVGAQLLKMQTLYLRIYNTKDTGKRAKSYTSVYKSSIADEATRCFTLGAELKYDESNKGSSLNLENGEYLVIPNLQMKPEKGKNVNYFLTFYTDLGENEFVVEFLDDKKNVGVSPWSSNESPYQDCSKFKEGTTHLFKNMIYTQPKAQKNAIEQAGFYRAATLGSLKMDEFDKMVQNIGDFMKLGNIL